MADNKLTAEERAVLEATTSGIAPVAREFGQLTPEDLAAINEEQRISREFDRPLTAAALAAARGASLGLSDLALESAGVSPDTLKNIKEQSPYISGTSEVAGAVAPLFVSAGTLAPAGALAKGAGAIGATVGKVAGKRAVGKIAAGATAGAIEGAGFAAGQAVSDSVLNNQKLTAESLLAYAGPGAVFGGTLGGILGAGAAIAPKIGAVAKPITSRVSGVMDDMLDSVKSNFDLLGIPVGRRAKLQDATGGRFGDDLLAYTKQNLVEPGTLNLVDDMVGANKRVLASTGQKLDDMANVLESLTAGRQEIVRQVNPWQRMLGILDEMAEKLSTIREISRGEGTVIKNMRNMVNRYAAEAAQLRLTGQGSGFKQLNELRKELGKISYNAQGTKLDNFKSEVADALRQSLRESTDDIAELISTQVGGDAVGLAQSLKEANKTYHLARTIKPFLATKAARSERLNLWEIIKGGDLRRQINIMTNVGQKVKSVREAITKSTESFFKKTTRPVLTTVNKGFSASGFAIDENNKVPKSEKQAYNNIRQAITSLAANENALITRLAKSTQSATNIHPMLGLEAQHTMVAALRFLNDKLPKSVSEGPSKLLFGKEYEPTSMEMAKFQRYLQVVEQPLTVLEELESGTLTREHVEALQYVYPTIYQEVRVGAMEFVHQHPDISYQKKLTLGILLDIPADESLEPDSVLGLQANFSPGVKQAVSGQPGPQPQNTVSSTAARNMSTANFASREASGVQKLQQDEA